ncbi:DgyrCDS4696 [Dimorphilus gyrociliatus]|uniref:DgyrCDS4696 n=1 Tax=Dimorphilus gyrociliatus TaxID=2664684 RepID=A0A7I8VHT5_9ANNE|nr:DgyrCDS4696 [Dimorphilus gyrociliatus]
MVENKQPNPLTTRNFSEVKISLENIIIPEEKLLTTPSGIDGLDDEIELQLRVLGCELIQTSGILLKLPQVAMATGQILYQRFYYSKSFVKHNFEIVAMACINLASKIEEDPRKIRDVINVFHHLQQIRKQKSPIPMILDQSYVHLKNLVIKTERRLLIELGFCVHVQHPHKIIMAYLKALRQSNTNSSERDSSLAQLAWNYMNDSLRTNLWVRYRPESIACACIFLASRKMQVPLPNRPPWYRVFNATDAEVEDISLTILKLYALNRLSVDTLEERVNVIKSAIAEAKKNAKATKLLTDTPENKNTPPVGIKSTATTEKNKIPIQNGNHIIDKSNTENYSLRDGEKERLKYTEDNRKLRKRSYESRSRSNSSYSGRQKSPKRRKIDQQKHNRRRRSNSRSSGSIYHRPRSHHRHHRNRGKRHGAHSSSSIKKYRNQHKRH